MKNILITTGVFAPDIGGPASYARMLGYRLTEWGISVTVLTYSSVRRHGGDKELPFRVHRVWKGLPWGIRHAIFFVRCWMLARKNSGVYALNAVSAGIPAVWAARLARRKIVVRIVGDYAWETAILKRKTYLLIDEFQHTKIRGRIRLFQKLQTWTCQKAAMVIVPSKYLANLVVGWGVEQEKVAIIYNGVHLSTVQTSREEARKHIGIPGSIVLSAGRLVPWKGFRMLIKLMPQLLQVNQFARLVIVGEGEDMRMLTSVVRNLGLERKVFLVGRKTQEELAWYLAAADMFVLNTGYEGFSHQVLEAMEAGVPVITTTVGGNREVIVQGQNGLLVRYNDEFNLVEAMKSIWKQAELRERLVTNGRSTAEMFGNERMAKQTMQLLKTTFS